jgi:hypothetical protein
MTNEEFDSALKDLGLSNVEAAQEMADLGDSKTAPSYVSAMRRGHKDVTQAAAIYVRLKQQLRGREISKSDVLEWIHRNSRDL